MQLRSSACLKGNSAFMHSTSKKIILSSCIVNNFSIIFNAILDNLQSQRRKYLGKSIHFLQDEKLPLVELYTTPMASSIEHSMSGAEVACWAASSARFIPVFYSIENKWKTSISSFSK